MAIKVFLTVIAVFALLACIGATQKSNKRLAAVVAVTALVILAVVVMKSDAKEETVTTVAPDSGNMQIAQDQWGTITVTDKSGVTTEYQGCIHVSGTYPYETYEFMGLCVSMEGAIEIAQWSPGLYKLYYEDQEAYWKMIEEKQQLEKENETNE